MTYTGVFDLMIIHLLLAILGLTAAPTAHAEPTASGIPVIIVEEPPASAEELGMRADATEREKEDLAAQLAMAKSAEESLLWLKLQTALSAVGFAALAYSLYLNRRATDAATGSANAAKEALSIQRDAQRAWVSYDGVDINAKVGPDGKLIGASLRFRWINSGQSPAIRSTIRYCCIEAPMSIDIEHVPRESLPPHSEQHSAPIGMGCMTLSAFMPIELSHLRVITSLTGRIFYWCEIIYWDSIDPQRERISEVMVEIEATEPLSQLLDVGRGLQDIAVRIIGPWNRMA